MISKTSRLLTVAILSCAAFPAVAPATAGTAAQATFVRTDTATQGTWKGVYGAGGYAIPNASPNQVPSYAAFTPQNQANWTWASYATAVQDLQVPGSNPSTTKQA